MTWKFHWTSIILLWATLNHHKSISTNICSVLLCLLHVIHTWYIYAIKSSYWEPHPTVERILSTNSLTVCPRGCCNFSTRTWWLHCGAISMELSINMPTNLFYAQHLTFHCEILRVDIFALLLSFGTSMDTFKVRIFSGFCFSKPFQVSI